MTVAGDGVLDLDRPAPIDPLNNGQVIHVELAECHRSPCAEVECNMKRHALELDSAD